jgi:hypothetical protein
MRRKHFLISVAAAALAVALGYVYLGHTVPTGQPPLRNLAGRNLAPMADVFNAAKGDVRVMLLLSPT